ncbi:HAD family hydrolase [Micromonospora sp. KC606]|uniref:HAD family hydrolase n=1 Tax=Micromonospora sp. KC606 TaxID=2530379 RepID=UPI0014050F5B|nr:HAD family hydrolase [Micromonospora sp. KC606]
MSTGRRTHILFDFFGTLVDYSASRTEQGYHRSHRLFRRLGGDLDYPDFLAAWSRASADFDRLSDRDDHEFSMTDVGSAFLAGTLGRSPTRAEVDAFVAEYIGEWNTGVTYSAAVVECVRALAGTYRLAVVTNTHQPDLVPDHLAAMGLLPCFDAVVTSVEVGWRKPHPAIYAATLDTLGIRAEAALFVGDTYRPDFAGPERAGMRAYLIDPERAATVPDGRRLASVLDLPDRLAAE